jgi:hypothetical protein
MRSADRWLAPTLAEFESFVAEGVWKIPDIDPALIPSNQIIPSMLVYDEQFYPDGSWKKDKCRLVSRGDVFKRMFLTENYSGTVRPEAVRMMLGAAAEMDLEMACVDAKTAFLSSPVEEGVTMYMRRPPGVPDSLMPEIVQLQKYIYGLPQASRNFASTLITLSGPWALSPTSQIHVFTRRKSRVNTFLSLCMWMTSGSWLLRRLWCRRQLRV